MQVFYFTVWEANFGTQAGVHLIEGLQVIWGLRKTGFTVACQAPCFIYMLVINMRKSGPPCANESKINMNMNFIEKFCKDVRLFLFNFVFIPAQSKPSLQL